MRVGYIQFAPKFGNKEYNLKKIAGLVAKARADLLVLPEMATTGYMVENRKELIGLAEDMNGPTVKALINIAKKNNLCLVAGLAGVDNGKIFSTAAAVGPDGLIAKHQKSHLFLKEKIYFDPGETKPGIFSWRGIKIGLGVCYDYMFPEFWRKLTLNGADLFCNTANFVYDYGFSMMRARSLENGVFAITVNRCGQERSQKFRGGSEIIDNRGVLIKKAGQAEEYFVTGLNLSSAKNKKWNKYNDLLADRKILSTADKRNKINHINKRQA